MKPMTVNSIAAAVINFTRLTN